MVGLNGSSRASTSGTRRSANVPCVVQLARGGQVGAGALLIASGLRRWGGVCSPVGRQGTTLTLAVCGGRACLGLFRPVGDGRRGKRDRAS